jgi:UDP-GlcNAc:undecaprenyl-phosphate GlcNAc-1-phosphate transferase
MLSLFLLWPTGSSLDLVLAVIGIGIWIGVQHLGYLEFGELARVAQRTLDQPQIFVNNLAIRRATEELKVARDYEQVRRILTAAFDANDFDGFELDLGAFAALVSFEGSAHSTRHERFRWHKSGVAKNLDTSAVWTVALVLLSSANHQCGTLKVFRAYSPRDLQLDINLLTSLFPRALADALDRTLSHPAQVIPIPDPDPALMAAQAG